MNNTNTNFENTDLLQRLIDAEVALQVKNKLEDINKPIDNSELFEALARAQANFDQVKKSGKANIPTKSGGNYSYNFAKLSDVLAATVPALNAEGIFFSQKPNYSLSSNAPMVTIVSTLSHKSGASISYESIPLFYNMNDAKQAGSVMTYLRRYGACQLLGIEGDDDDDAHVATMNNSSNYKSNQQTRQQAPAAKQHSAIKQGTSKPVASTPKSVEQQPKPEPIKSVEPVAEQTAEKPVEQVATQTPTVQSTHQTCPPSPEGQVQAEESATESKETETVTIPQAPNRDMSVVFQSGLESAKHFGATEEQLAEWQAMTHEEAIREMSIFVRDKASGK